MSVTTPAYTIPRRSVASHIGEWVKMFDPPTESPATPERMNPTNVVPEIMKAAGVQDKVSIGHTVQRNLLIGKDIAAWDGKKLHFFIIGDGDNPTLKNGT